MGVYVYKTKPTATAIVTVELADGQRSRMQVQVYEFAFKCFRYEEDERTWKRICGPSERAFERRGTKPLAYGVSAYEGAMSLGEPVFPTRGQVAAVEIGDVKPIGKVVAIHSGLKVFRSQPQQPMAPVRVVTLPPTPAPVPALAGEPCKPAATMAVLSFE